MQIEAKPIVCAVRFRRKSLCPGDEAKQETLKALKSATGYIRTEVGKRLGIRYSPTIVFKEDTSLDYGMKIDKILRDIEKKD